MDAKTKKLAISGFTIIPVMWLLAAATSSPPSSMNSPFGYACPFALLAGAVCMGKAAARMAETRSRRLLYVILAVVLALAVAAASSFLCLMIWGGIA